MNISLFNPARINDDPARRKLWMERVLQVLAERNCAYLVVLDELIGNNDQAVMDIIACQQSRNLRDLQVLIVHTKKKVSAMRQQEHHAPTEESLRLEFSHFLAWSALIHRQCRYFLRSTGWNDFNLYFL